MAAVAGRSVCSLATMDPDGFRLVRKRSERPVSSIMGVLQVNAYIFDNEFPGRELVVRSTQCNRDAMRYEDISEKTRCEIFRWIGRTSQCRLRPKEGCMVRQSWTGSPCGSWDGK